MKAWAGSLCGFTDLRKQAGNYVCKICGYVLPPSSLRLLSPEERAKLDKA